MLVMISPVKLQRQSACLDLDFMVRATRRLEYFMVLFGVFCATYRHSEDGWIVNTAQYVRIFLLLSAVEIIGKVERLTLPRFPEITKTVSKESFLHQSIHQK